MSKDRNKTKNTLLKPDYDLNNKEIPGENLIVI